MSVSCTLSAAWPGTRDCHPSSAAAAVPLRTPVSPIDVASVVLLVSPPCHSSPPWAKAGFKMVRSLLHLRPCELSLFIYSFFLSIDLSGSTARSVSTGRSGSLRGRSAFSSLLCDDRPDCRVMWYSLSLSLSHTNHLFPLITRTRL